jgi:hypothetical protein
MEFRMTTPLPVHLPPPPNPFATRYTGPAAGEYLFPADTDADTLLARLRAARWWGQITGPHGSGKSTLVQTLLPRIEAAGRVIDFYALHAAAPSSTGVSTVLGRRRASVASWSPTTQIVFDGYEQLGWLQRTWWKWQCRRRGAGLLVTGHFDLGLPPLWHTETSAELTRLVIARLLGESDPAWLCAGQVERLFAAHRGNVREILFALYDLYEQRLRHGPQDQDPEGFPTS